MAIFAQISDTAALIFASWTSVLLTALLVILVALFSTSKYFVFYTRTLPPGPTLIPLIGCIPGIIGDFTGDYFMKQSLKFKSKIISMRLFGGMIVSLNDYDLIKEVFLRRTDLVDRQEVDLFKVADSEREGMILTSGRVWRDSRRFALHMLRDFGMGKMGSEDSILQECEKSIRAFTDHGGLPCDPLPIINMAVSNVINSIVMGKQFEYDDERFQNSLTGLNEFMRAVSKPKVVFLMLPIGRLIFKNDLIQLRKHYKQFDQFVVEEMDEHKKLFKGQVTDFIYAYLSEMENKDDKSVFNEKQLRYLIQDLFIAGSETTFTTLRWALLYMAAHPDIQHKVYNELREAMGERQPTMNDKKHTPYTEAVLSEVQRLNTLIGLGIAHTSLSQDFDIEGYCIPKGTPVMANLQQVHRDERLWKKPDEFYPENFLDETGHFVHGDRLVPFSIGRRQCAGESLARMELYLFFCSWIKHFRIKTESESTVPDLIGNIVGVNAPSPYKLRLLPRGVTNGVNGVHNGLH